MSQPEAKKEDLVFGTCCLLVAVVVLTGWRAQLRPLPVVSGVMGTGCLLHYGWQRHRGRR